MHRTSVAPLGLKPSYFTDSLIPGLAPWAIDDRPLRGFERAFPEGLYEEITNKASCLSLLSNAVPVWNTVRMGGIVVRLRAAGETVSDEDMARISPLAYAHVIPNGTYVFDRSRWGHTAPNMLP